MKARSRSAEPSAAPAAEALALLKSLRKPFVPLGFHLPGLRGRLLSRLGRAEAVLEVAANAEAALAAVVGASAQIREDVAGNRQAMEKLSRVQENRSVQDQILHQNVQEQIKSLLGIAEGNLRLAEREEAVKQREAFARETGSRLQAQLETATRRQEETQASLREANSLFAGVQALQEQTHQRQREAAEEAKRRQRDVAEETSRRQREAAEQTKALDERSGRLEAFKVQLQAREQTLQQSQNRLASVEQQRGALEEEIQALKKQRLAEVARGEELVRERERALVKREEEVASVSLLMLERERALQERENEIQAREAERTQLEAAAAALKATITEKDKQVTALDGAVRALTEHGHELQQMLAGLSARL